MKKIEIKLKECCLDCEHFDPSGCVGIVPSVFCCGEPDRVIACGHMEVCEKYNNSIKVEDDFGWIEHELPSVFWDKGIPSFAYECKKCHEASKIMSKFCPHCGQKNMR